MKFILSFDDYNLGNIELAKIVKGYGLEKNTIFFIDLDNGNKKNCDQIIELDKMGFQLGSHGMQHDNNLKSKSYEIKKWQIFQSKKVIEGLINKKVEWFCYNRGRSDQQIRDLVKEAGYKYARGTKVLSTDYPQDLYNMETSCHFFKRDEYKGQDWVTIAKKTFNQAKKKNGYWHGWGHYSELSRPGEMDKLKELLKYINENRI